MERKYTLSWEEKKSRFRTVNMFIYICVCVCVHVYIYIRERNRMKEWKQHSQNTISNDFIVFYIDGNVHM